MCYPPAEGIRRRAARRSAQSEMLALPPDYLKRNGYRLPTEVEWEYACRAGTTTLWSHGSSENMLDEYGWYAANSHNTMHPAGMLKPNLLGLFDMHDNAWQWCHADPSHPHDEDKTHNSSALILRGGSFSDPADRCRSNSPWWLDPRAGYPNVGFRVARTCP